MSTNLETTKNQFVKNTISQLKLETGLWLRLRSIVGIIAGKLYNSKMFYLPWDGILDEQFVKLWKEMKK